MFRPCALVITGLLLAVCSGCSGSPDDSTGEMSADYTHFNHLWSEAECHRGKSGANQERFSVVATVQGSQHSETGTARFKGVPAVEGPVTQTFENGKIVYLLTGPTGDSLTLTRPVTPAGTEGDHGTVGGVIAGRPFSATVHCGLDGNGPE